MFSEQFYAIVNAMGINLLWLSIQFITLQLNLITNSSDSFQSLCFDDSVGLTADR